MDSSAISQSFQEHLKKIFENFRPKNPTFSNAEQSVILALAFLQCFNVPENATKWNLPSRKNQCYTHTTSANPTKIPSSEMSQSLQEHMKKNI